jgi:predicted DNA-binding transcriptional regulator YafY
MKRTDRLMAILMALQQRPETAQSLAAKLEVSKRTIFRDMEALAEMGVPLYAMPGPAGGYRLMDGYLLLPVHLDSREALAVLVALNAMTKLSDTPFNQARWTAIDKIRGVLPTHVMQEVEPVLTRLEMSVPDRMYKTPFMEELLKHTAADSWIRALYRSERQERWLLLKPRKIYTSRGFWYCEAYSHVHKEERSFRVDRFSQLEVSEAPDDGMQAADSHEKAGSEQEPIGIHVTLTYRGALLAEQDEHIGQMVRHIADDSWELDFQCPAPEYAWAVRFFYTLGRDAMVLQPERLRQDIVKKAMDLALYYQTSGITEASIPTHKLDKMEG